MKGFIKIKDGREIRIKSIDVIGEIKEWSGKQVFYLTLRSGLLERVASDTLEEIKKEREMVLDEIYREER